MYYIILIIISEGYKLRLYKIKFHKSVFKVRAIKSHARQVTKEIAGIIMSDSVVLPIVMCEL